METRLGLFLEKYLTEAQKAISGRQLGAGAKFEFELRFSPEPDDNESDIDDSYIISRRSWFNIKEWAEENAARQIFQYEGEEEQETVVYKAYVHDMVESSPLNTKDRGNKFYIRRVNVQEVKTDSDEVRSYLQKDGILTKDGRQIKSYYEEKERLPFQSTQGRDEIGRAHV